MYLVRVSTIILAAIGAVSAGEVPPPSFVNQANQCANSGTVYCCNNEVKHGGAADCTAMDMPTPWPVFWV